jgi:hypothetical protein
MHPVRRGMLGGQARQVQGRVPELRLVWEWGLLVAEWR